jgi:predicted nucleic acid-binding Zn ribbon protein
MALSGFLEIFERMQRRNPALKKRLREATAFDRWAAVVGPGIARHAKALRIVDQILWVEVDHPIWRAELHARKNQILEAIQKDIESDGKVLLDIRFVDPRPQQGFGSQGSGVPSNPSSRFRPK